MCHQKSTGSKSSKLQLLKHRPKSTTNNVLNFSRTKQIFKKNIILCESKVETTKRDKKITKKKYKI